MTRLPILALLLFVVFSADAWAGQREHMKALVMVQADKHGVPPLILAGTCDRESRFNWYAVGLDEPAKRKKAWKRTENDYSYGLCQIKIATARFVWSVLVYPQNRREVNPWDVMDPAFNAETAALYMRWLRDRYGDWKLALTAYNRGHEPYMGESWKTHVTRLRDASGEGSYAATIYTKWIKLQTQANGDKVRDLPGLYLMSELADGRAMTPFNPGG